MELLEQAWEEREDVVYKKIFGDLGSGVYPLEEDIFLDNFNQESCDMRWLQNGIFESPPNGSRDTWLYVSSGMSNPWDAKEAKEFSGFGVELVLETKESSEWAIEILQTLLAYNILLAYGVMDQQNALTFGDTVPFSIDTDGEGDSLISNMIFVEPSHYAKDFNLISGKVNFMQILGITDKELKLFEELGLKKFVNKLIETGVYPIIDRKRECILDS